MKSPNLAGTVALLLSLLAFAAAGTTEPAEEALLPFNTGWEYPQFTTFRPDNGKPCDVNPPRFSWPYVPHVLTYDENVPRHDFAFQLSVSGDFISPDIEVKTPYNFYNALAPLAPGTWHWRTGYWVGTEREQWSLVRTFDVSEDTSQWDRSPIAQAVEALHATPHPRLGPSDGDWQRLHRRFEEAPRLAAWLAEAMQQGRKATQSDWWKAFPSSDQPGEGSYQSEHFAEMARSISLTAFLYRLTGHQDFRHSKDLALLLAAFPKGGVTSPEYHGGDDKRATQITEFLSLAYDWWHPDLNDSERQALLHAIEWRLEATYLQKGSWAAGSDMYFRSVSILSGSHPYENFMWSLPAVLLTGGDLPLADELTPLCLNYLTGVTAAHGPDEGWNEGYSYGTYKSGTMLGASMVTAMLLPELNIGTNPFYDRFGDWYAHLAPLGISRVPFGNYGDDIEAKRPRQREVFRYLAWLTGTGRFAYYENVLMREQGDPPSERPWLDLLAAVTLEAPKPEASPKGPMLFPEAGWVMANPQPVFDREAFKRSTGMIFQCRPRGGYSHSFRAENDYVWYAHGATLSAGAGSTIFRDPHAYGTISHNGILINGEGQEWNYHVPDYPFSGRLLAYHQGDGYTYWVGDATHSYQTVPGLLRCHRHVVFVDKSWFAVFDDIAMRPEAQPARFSWLFQIKPTVPVTANPERTNLSYTVDSVNASVTLSYPDTPVELLDVTGRDAYVNQVTGQDLFEEAVAGIEVKGTREMSEKHWMGHTIWLTNHEPQNEWTVMAILTAAKENAPPPEVAMLGERAVRVTLPGRHPRTISFDPAVEADIAIDLEAVRTHALDTDPGRIPLTGPRDQVTLDGDTYTVEWLAKETFERDDWVSRWVFEGNSEINVRDGRLWVRRTVPEQNNTATIWYRPELPQNVMVRFRAQPVGDPEFNAANLNLFLHARELDGSPLRFGRSGDYGEYHEFPNYIVTFTGGYRKGWSRARRDPGFTLISEDPIRSEVGKEYAIAVTFENGRLRYYINGKRIHDVTDPEPLPGGRFGIRSWTTIGWWDDIEFGKLISGDH